jgi:pimeloyl-ACP methyl ester carboxylesterase
MALKLVLVALVVVVVLPIILTAACGRALLYHPTQLGKRERAMLTSMPGWQQERVQVDEDLELVGLSRPPPAASAPWLLFYGGNAMGLVAGQQILSLIAGNAPWGLAVFAYRGYDGSGGRPTEEGLHADALAHVAHLAERHAVGTARLVVIGQSLGTGVAAHLAATLAERGSPPAALVLLSPYTSMAQVFDDQVPLVPVGWVAPDPYRTYRLVDDIDSAVLIVHGSADGLIRVEHGRRLAQAFGDRALYLELDGRHHNDLWDDPRTAVAIREMVGRILAAPEPPERTE